MKAKRAPMRVGGIPQPKVQPKADPLPRLIRERIAHHAHRHETFLNYAALDMGNAVDSMERGLPEHARIQTDKALEFYRRSEQSRKMRDDLKPTV